ncbi:hypothetical protein AAIH18_22340, partial [Pantoea agglomerans]|uniref:hypothetical protein n=1 Tax=Enterobacter agglomerans TaxID=549 RepID=UPI003D2C7A22
MRIRVDHEPLAQSIATLANTADRISGVLEELDAYVQVLLDRHRLRSPGAPLPYADGAEHAGGDGHH